MDSANWPYFFVRAAMSLVISGVMGLAIGKVVSMRANIAVSFLG